MIDAVENIPVKNLLKEVNIHLNRDDYVSSLTKSAEAFYSLLDNYENKKLGPFGKSPFDFRSSISTFGYPTSDDPFGIDMVAKNTEKAIKSMGNVLKIICLGIDYRKYAKFKILTPPQIAITAGPDSYYFTHVQNSDEIKKDDVNFCIDFVIETA